MSVTASRGAPVPRVTHLAPEVIVPVASDNPNLLRSYSLSEAAWVIGVNRWMVERWLDQGVFPHSTVIRTDARKGHCRVRFTERGIHYGRMKRLSQMIEGSNYEDNYLIVVIKNSMQHMLARMDKIR